MGSTPSFFVNGAFISGAQPVAEFQKRRQPIEVGQEPDCHASRVVGRHTLGESTLRGAFTSAVRAYVARGTTDLVLNLAHLQ